MTLTDRSMGWLNQNRMRSYPMVRDEWRKKVSPESGLDCVILDALLFDSDANGDEELELVSVSVTHESTSITMRYGGIEFHVPAMTGGETSGDGSYSSFRASVQGNGTRAATISLVFSSHAYILGSVGEGHWEIGCRVLDSRVVRISDGMGVDGIYSNGSKGVPGHEVASLADGDVVLEDGYRTSPVVLNGRVLVRVGNRYGYDPCTYGYGEDGNVECRSPLFFFCGQNAINGGNIVLKGGKGITVTQGRSYNVRSGSCKGKTIPCIEIVAGRELIDILKTGK